MSVTAPLSTLESLELKVVAAQNLVATARVFLTHAALKYNELKTPDTIHGLDTRAMSLAHALEALDRAQNELDGARPYEANPYKA